MDDMIKAIKENVLLNLDRRFPDSPAIKPHQIIDHATKGLLPRDGYKNSGEINPRNSGAKSHQAMSTNMVWGTELRLELLQKLNMIYM